jgi:hypothetical protein
MLRQEPKHKSLAIAAVKSISGSTAAVAAVVAEDKVD